ncbi:MAG: cyclase family protein [Vicingaceae bacterium]|nr:cyclase family protein [Vicingaceae bacterium]
MKTTIEYRGTNFKVDLSKPLDISMPLIGSSQNVTAWYVNPPEFTPVMENGFIGDVNLGGAVNFRNIFFNPHGHGTHTECVGHISKEQQTINQCLKQFTFYAKLVTITPYNVNGDSVIMLEQVEKVWQNNEADAIIIRTLPNSDSKLGKQYSDTNPTYVQDKAMQFLVDNGVKHFLIDTPSVDREQDDGKLISHHIFWDYPKNPQTDKTITELIYVSNDIEDDYYILQFQIASFENDASPSKPTLYQIE